MMTQSEFVEATSRLERYYDKEYSNEQLKIMYDFLKVWNKEKYIKAINYCLQNNKYLPKIADLTGANINIAKVKEDKRINFVKCNRCNGEGFIKYFREVKNGNNIIKYEYIALCTCENAKKQKEINKYNLPTLAEVGL